MQLGAKVPQSFLPLIGIVALLGTWHVAALAAGQPKVFPGPYHTIQAAGGLLSSGYGWDLTFTSVRAITSWTIALLLGVPIGLMLGYFRWAHDASQAVVAFFRSLPAFMLVAIPATLGLNGELSRLATISFASLLIIIDECAESISTLPQDRVDIIRSNRGTTWFIISRVLFFEALGRAVVPVARTTIGVSFVVTIVCESLVIPFSGIGARLLTSLTALELPSVYAFLLLTGVAGLILNWFVHVAARRFIFWT